jgi:hypothetical protein
LGFLFLLACFLALSQPMICWLIFWPIREHHWQYADRRGDCGGGDHGFIGLYCGHGDVPRWV